jgi:hypothetical protein
MGQEDESEAKKLANVRKQSRPASFSLAANTNGKLVAF